MSELNKELYITKSQPSSKVTFGWILFYLVWPFAALISTLSQFRSHRARVIAFMFCIYFGFVFIIPKDKVGAADSARYATYLFQAHYHPLSFNTLLSLIYNSKEGGFTDVYQPLVTWLVAIFTDDPRWLFAVFAAVFGYFFTQNLWLVYSRMKGRLSIFLLLFIIFLPLIIPIWNINGVRMWTAAHVYLYGILFYYLNGQKQGILWSALSIFFHFSFLFPVAVLFIFLMLPEFTTLFFIFYITTAFIREINLLVVRESLSFLPEVFQPKVETYTDETYAETIREAAKQLQWHVVFAQVIGRYLIYAWVLVSYIFMRHWSNYLPESKRLFGFALFLAGWSQLASLVPSGGRFILLTNFLFYAIFILMLSVWNPGRRIGIIKSITVPLILFLIIFSFRTGLDYTGFMTFVGNPIAAIFIEEQMPLIELIKEFIK